MVTWLRITIWTEMLSCHLSEKYCRPHIRETLPTISWECNVTSRGCKYKHSISFFLFQAIVCIWKINKQTTNERKSLCVCTRMHVCVGVCVHVCRRMRACAYVCVHVYVYVAGVLHCVRVHAYVCFVSYSFES